MIKSYRDKKTSVFANGEFVRIFQGFSRQAEKRLEILDAAEITGDLTVLPSNRFEALSGDRVGQFSIRINQQWHICFEWRDDGPENVEIVDYH
ncbi:type II toxin-antitoxin system RelE/ParE family toxin [Lentilitoribacter sp. Alg239-R112]|uniref:type II toxin-antitoxin system RelE/ParE family toxin n=1 Tax=Lentilitoribacter sp. Alg239-R112 TaxID=2305987 RepID=UPI0013A69B33|nr:type II toxin-antitoxin system RelE/ParE family toxin [Lentilitoribacter sp. Alg239-R112]